MQHLFGISLLTGLFTTWAVFTSLLVLLLIYRSIIEMHEDDQIFLHDGEARLQAEQQTTVARLRKLRPYIRSLTAVSIVLIVIVAGMKLYQDLGIR